MKIGILAPATRLTPELADGVRALARNIYPADPPELLFHPQCFLSDGHFAGGDKTRATAFLEYAADESIDAVWFARGGYGSNRIASAVAHLPPSARGKIYLGYSDCGYLLAALYRDGYRAAHGPMPADLTRFDGASAVARALKFLMTGARDTLEPSLKPGIRAAAFNITVLSQMLATALQPDLAGHVLMLEDVSEYMYRIDRSLFHLTANPNLRLCDGIRLGRVSEIPPNDPDFGADEESLTRHWCKLSGIPYLGRADIGHDSGNKIVPFGGWYWER